MNFVFVFITVIRICSCTVFISQIYEGTLSRCVVFVFIFQSAPYTSEIERLLRWMIFCVGILRAYITATEFIPVK